MDPNTLAVVAAVLGGGGIAGLITAIVSLLHERHSNWSDLARAQAEDLIRPLEEHIERLQRQVDELEEYRDRYNQAVSYMRSLCHWLSKVTNLIDDDILTDNPKPRLPDDLRDDVDPLCGD